MGINWLVRIKNKTFWMALIPALFLLAQSILTTIGFSPLVNLDELQANILKIVDAIFTVLAILGIVVDPTTKGVSDSVRAMGYEEPNDDH